MVEYWSFDFMTRHNANINISKIVFEKTDRLRYESRLAWRRIERSRILTRTIFIKPEAENEVEEASSRDSEY
jgi:hypothetical protein